MKTLTQILLLLVVIVTLISGYWSLARYTDLVYDAVLMKGKWENISPFNTFIFGVLTTLILIVLLKYFKLIIQVVNPIRTFKIGVWSSLFFILLATAFWSESWLEEPNALRHIPDARELGDGIWKLGHPLTFLIIDLPIYLRQKFEIIQNYWSDYWAFPAVLVLFVIQFSIYIQGIRMVLNINRIKTAYNKV